MNGVVKKCLVSPGDHAHPPTADRVLVDLGSVSAAKLMLPPGWRRSERTTMHDRTACMPHRAGVAVSGTLHVCHDDGVEADIGPGDAYVIEPGHDAWVVGSEPFVGYEFETTVEQLLAAGLPTSIGQRRPVDVAARVAGATEPPVATRPTRDGTGGVVSCRRGPRSWRLSPRWDLVLFAAAVTALPVVRIAFAGSDDVPAHGYLLAVLACVGSIVAVVAAISRMLECAGSHLRHVFCSTYLCKCGIVLSATAFALAARLLLDEPLLQVNSEGRLSPWVATEAGSFVVASICLAGGLSAFIDARQERRREIQW